MSEFVSDYKAAFTLKNVISLRRWVYFTLKSMLLFLLLVLFFSILQYVAIVYTPLFEYVTVPGIKLSNMYGIAIVLVVSFGPSVLYLIRIFTR